MNKNAVPPVSLERGKIVESENDRVKLEMEILKYRNFLRFVEDKEFRANIRGKIAELEQQLREIDE
jgi:protein-arginine kinase activator protein McsA